MPNRCPAQMGRRAVHRSDERADVERLGRRFGQFAVSTRRRGEASQADQVPKLKLKWAFGFLNANSMYSQPTVVGGRVYVGANNGTVYSLDAKTGCLYWSFQAAAGVRTAPSIGPIRNGYAVYFGDVKANVYAVDARTGKQIWTQRTDPHPIGSHHRRAGAGRGTTLRAGVLARRTGRVEIRNTSAAHFAAASSPMTRKPESKYGRPTRFHRSRSEPGRRRAAHSSGAPPARRSGPPRPSI